MEFQELFDACMAVKKFTMADVGGSVLEGEMTDAKTEPRSEMTDAKTEPRIEMTAEAFDSETPIQMKIREERTMLKAIRDRCKSSDSEVYT